MCASNPDTHLQTILCAAANNTRYSTSHTLHARTIHTVLIQFERKRAGRISILFTVQIQAYNEDGDDKQLVESSLLVRRPDLVGVHEQRLQCALLGTRWRDTIWELTGIGL
jgi:hypothetical protein